jgi:hypothetical protein
MTGDENVFTRCDGCKRPIAFDHVQVSVNRNVEQAQQLEDAPPAVVIQVIDSDTLLKLCGSCGNKLSSEAITEALQALLAKQG